jgi:hypothetical protein
MSRRKHTDLTRYVPRDGALRHATVKASYRYATKLNRKPSRWRD